MASTQGGCSLLKGANSPRPAGCRFVLLVPAGRAEGEKQSRAMLVLSALSGARQGEREQNPKHQISLSHREPAHTVPERDARQRVLSFGGLGTVFVNITTLTSFTKTLRVTGQLQTFPAARYRHPRNPREASPAVSLPPQPLLEDTCRARLPVTRRSPEFETWELGRKTRGGAGPTNSLGG